VFHRLHHHALDNTSDKVTAEIVITKDPYFGQGKGEVAPDPFYRVFADAGNRQTPDLEVAGQVPVRVNFQVTCFARQDLYLGTENSGKRVGERFQEFHFYGFFR